MISIDDVNEYLISVMDNVCIKYFPVTMAVIIIVLATLMLVGILGGRS